MAPLPANIETRLFLNNEVNTPSQTSPHHIFFTNAFHKFVEAKSGQTFKVTNPYDGQEIPSPVHIAGAEDVAFAVKYARAAFTTGPWATYTGTQRALPMLKLADLIEKYMKELADLDSLTMGGPAGVNSALIGAAAATFRCACPRVDIHTRREAH